MTFQSKDEEIQRRILVSLFERKTINMNNEVGCAYLQPEWEDKINPSVKITRDEIKRLTGREKLRDVVLQEYEHALSKRGVSVQRIDPDTLQVSLVPERCSENDFSSLDNLVSRNKSDLDENPELGEPPY